MPIAKCVNIANLASRLAKTVKERAFMRVEYHSLVSSSCELFAACYDLCFVNTPRQTRSQQHSIVTNVERSADKLRTDVIDWLDKCLPYRLSHDTKHETYKEELDVSGNLKTITFMAT